MAGIGLTFLLEGFESTQSDDDKLPFIQGQVFSLIHDAIMNRTPVGHRRVQGKKGPRKKQFGEHLQDQWTIDMDLNPERPTATIGTDVVYASMLEFGGYLGVGPRTVATAGGIFSRQAPGGMIKPLVEDPKVFDEAIAQAVQEVNRRFAKIVRAK